MSQALAVSHAAFGRATLYRLDRPIVEHAHREGHLIFYVSGATARMDVGDNSVLLDETRAVAVGPWEPHNFYLEDTSRGSACTCLVLYIKPFWFLENGHADRSELRFGSPSVPNAAALSRLASRLAAILTNDTEPVDATTPFFELTRLAYLSSWDVHEGRLLVPADVSKSSDYRVRRSLQLLRTHSGEQIEIENVAREVGLSRPHFFKLFKQQIGIPPTMYVNTLRSERAIETLITTDRTVADIAEELGFSSQASFSRFFAANVGIPPSEYRRVAHIA